MSPTLFPVTVITALAQLAETTAEPRPYSAVEDTP
jgi:hypothetical protein